VAGGARNLGTRRVDGLELHLQTRLPVTARTIIQGWLYGTEYLRMREQKFDQMGNFTGNGDIGDLAKSKMQLGLTASFDDKLIGTLRGRLIGNRIPIDTNPIRKIKGYITMDASFTARDLVVKGLGCPSTSSTCSISTTRRRASAAPTPARRQAASTPLASGTARPATTAHACPSRAAPSCCPSGSICSEQTRGHRRSRGRARRPSRGVLI
jgi:hypothetical protein